MFQILFRIEPVSDRDLSAETTRLLRTQQVIEETAGCTITAQLVPFRFAARSGHWLIEGGRNANAFDWTRKFQCPKLVATGMSSKLVVASTGVGFENLNQSLIMTQLHCGRWNASNFNDRLDMLSWTDSLSHSTMSAARTDHRPRSQCGLCSALFAAGNETNPIYPRSIHFEWAGRPGRAVEFRVKTTHPVRRSARGLGAGVVIWVRFEEVIDFRAIPRACKSVASDLPQPLCMKLSQMNLSLTAGVTWLLALACNLAGLGCNCLCNCCLWVGKWSWGFLFEVCWDGKSTILILGGRERDSDSNLGRRVHRIWRLQLRPRIQNVKSTWIHRLRLWIQLNSLATCN